MHISLICSICTFSFDSNFLQILMHFLYLADNCVGFPENDAGGIILAPGD
jgi:hypothetical protein